MGLTSYAIAAMLLILVETALVVWLLLHRAAGRRAQRLLEDRLRFETLLAELSAKLIHVESAGMDAALENALRRMIDVLGMDRGNLDEYLDDAPGIRVSCARPGIVELPSILAAGQFPWTVDTLRGGGVVRFSRRTELPESASVDRASYDRLGTRSHLSIPLRAGGPMLGVLSLDSVRDEHAWPDDLVDRLHLLSEAFASALERKRMELSLAQRLGEAGRLRQELTHIGRVSALGELTASLAHELNQPLTALSNYGKACRLMLHGDDEQRSRLSETVEKIEHEVSRAGAVVHRLRDFLRNGTTRLAPLAAEQLLQQVCASFGERCKQCGIALTLQAAPDLQPLLIDRTQIEIALDNLLRNACDSIVASAAARRAIHVNVEREAPGYVRVSVRDSGPGIRSEQVHQVFDSIASSKETGMGLGLTLSRAIIEAHGGRLWTEAAASGVFHFTLPEIETPQDEADTV